MGMGAQIQILMRGLEIDWEWGKYVSCAAEKSNIGENRTVWRLFNNAEHTAVVQNSQEGVSEIINAVVEFR